MQKQKHTTIRYKITLSYLLLVLLAIAAISVLYKGIHNIVLLDTDTTKPNNKLKHINQILTDVYEAERFSRSYFLFRNDTDLIQYVITDEKISKGIDSLKILCASDTNQVKNLNSIDKLLEQKSKIITELVVINRETSTDISYARVIEEVYLNSYNEIIQPIIIEGTTSIKSDSIYSLKEKKGLLNAVKKIFSSTTQIDNKKLTKTTVEQYTTYDTIYQPIPISDSLVYSLKKALTNFKTRNDFAKQQAISQETQLLHSDRIILDRIRNIISSLETEEIIYTSSFLDKSREIIKQANYSVIVLGGFAFLLVFLFLFIIYRDIERTKGYQAELMKARQFSDDLLAMKEQFVATISHEIRTPLSAIIGFSEQLKKSKNKKNQTVCADNIELASKNLRTLVNNVLDLSKSNAGKIELESIPFTIKELVEVVFRTFSIEATSKGLLFNCYCDDTTNISLTGDKYRLNQIITNLVNNAIKFTEKGMVDIIGKISDIDTNTVMAEIIVFDTGIGIPADKITYIFEEFAQVNNEITRKYGGTGLGLSIAGNLAKLMKGEIIVNSTEGQGSTFILRIPLGKNKNYPVTDSDYELSQSVKSKKILLVEDDETLRILFDQLFLNNNLNGKIAQNAEDALKILSTDSFDIVFTDIQMPGMSGIELCKLINTTFDQPIPVIAYTARNSISDTYSEMGFSGFLSKPFTETQFLHMLSVFLLNKNSSFYQEEIATYTFDKSNTYSLAQIKEFTGNNPESLQMVVDAFIENTGKDLEAIRKNIENEEISNIAKKIHKLLPMFKQMQINKLIDEMQMIERYEELNLEEQDVLLFAENFVENAEKIIKEIQHDYLQT